MSLRRNRGKPPSLRWVSSDTARELLLPDDGGRGEGDNWYSVTSLSYVMSPVYVEYEAKSFPENSTLTGRFHRYHDLSILEKMKIGDKEMSVDLNIIRIIELGLMVQAISPATLEAEAFKSILG